MIEQVAKESTSQEILGIAKDVAKYLDVGGVPRYGVVIDKAEADPAKKVTYIGAARGMIPAHMNFSAGAFDYGDWGNIWFVKGNKPCMVRQSDRKVDYYLDPNDYAKKADGGDESDITNDNYEGNAMAEFPLVYFDCYESAGKQYLWACQEKFNERYKAYAHTREDGSIADAFYWSIYGGSVVNETLRSLSGKTLQNTVTTEVQMTAAGKNGTGWSLHTWSQRVYIQNLLLLIGCSTDTQAVFGNGNCRQGQNAAAMLATGTLDKKGQFWGTNKNSTEQVKVLHVEKFWGDQWDRTLGMLNDNTGLGLMVKMTPPYNLTGDGYIKTGVVMSGTNGGYISEMIATEYGFLPKVVSGSGTTQYCDGGWFNNEVLAVAICGAGANHAAAFGGAWAFDAVTPASYAYWNDGCGLSCEMPAAA